jgi:PhnB protein
VLRTLPCCSQPQPCAKAAASRIGADLARCGAEELSRLTTRTGQIVAELSIDGAPFNVVDENPEGSNLSPERLGATSVRIDLVADDPDTVAQRTVAAGARTLFPIADQSYVWRQGRVVDPYGHHWLIGKPPSAD